MKMTFKKQLTIVLLLVGIIPFLIMGGKSYYDAEAALHGEAFAKLEAVNAIKKKQLEQLIHFRKADLNNMANTDNITNITRDLIIAHKQLKVKGTDDYPVKNEMVKAITNVYEPFFQNFMKVYGYYDVFVICEKHGHVMYSSSKESDYGQNLNHGPLKNEGLGEVWKRVKQTKEAQIVDMEAYSPSNGAPAMFMGMPIKGEKGNIISIIVIQISDRMINGITTKRDGLGETGETYIVGPDYKMRSDSLLDDNFTLANSFKNPSTGSIKTDTVKEALKGNKATIITKNYIGQDVLSSYDSIDVGGVKWAIISEVNISEVDKPIIQLKTTAMVMGVVFVILIIVISIILVNVISKPIIKSVEHINQGAEQVASASSQISGSSQQLAEGSQEQAASVEQITSSLAETKATVDQNAENAREADILSSDANDAAKLGYTHIQELSTSMIEINDSSREIEKIIKTIDEIAFQTNLLALNAAVEAARAGEHGLGFAVVAEEVRNLAQRSAEAAKDTANIIERSIEQVRRGNEITDETNKAFKDILEKVKKTGDITGEIAMASKEQAQGIQQITEAIAQVDSVTQTMASGSEESAASSEELSAQAEEMKKAIEVVAVIFGIDIENVRNGNRNNTETPKQRRKIKQPIQEMKTSANIMPLDESDIREF